MVKNTVARCPMVVCFVNHKHQELDNVQSSADIFKKAHTLVMGELAAFLSSVDMSREQSVSCSEHVSDLDSDSTTTIGTEKKKLWQWHE